MASTKKRILGVVGSAVATVLLPLVVHMISTIITGRSGKENLEGIDSSQIDGLEQEGVSQ